MATGELITCASNDEWKNQKDSGKPLVVFFTASWYGPSITFIPKVAQVAREFTDIAFLMVDVDFVKSAVEEHNVSEYPTLVFINRGEPQIVPGKREEKLENLRKLLGDA